MDVSKERLAEVVERLRKERDELRVKLHLGGMEAKEQWDELEKKWNTLEARAGQAKQEVAEKAGDTRAALGVIATELEAAYHRIKNDLRTE